MCQSALNFDPLSASKVFLSAGKNDGAFHRPGRCLAANLAGFCVGGYAWRGGARLQPGGSDDAGFMPVEISGGYHDAVPVLPEAWPTASSRIEITLENGRKMSVSDGVSLDCGKPGQWQKNRKRELKLGRRRKACELTGFFIPIGFDLTTDPMGHLV